MTTWIALLRGINVGGHNVLPMKELRALLERLGYAEVATYIQSGNCVFAATATDADGIATKIGDAIAQTFGFHPEVMVMSEGDLEAAVTANPFPSGDPKSVHLYFLKKPAHEADLDAISAKAKTEQFVLTDTVFYLHAPDGIGRSKLAANVERHLGVATTARNLRSATKILELAKKT